VFANIFGGIIIIIIIIIIAATAAGFSLLGAFGKLRKVTINFVMSVCPSVRLSARNISTTKGGFSLNFIFDYFSKLCLQYSSVFKI